jgi:hypothetical protein
MGYWKQQGEQNIKQEATGQGRWNWSTGRKTECIQYLFKTERF